MLIERSLRFVEARPGTGPVRGASKRFELREGEDDAAPHAWSLAGGLEDHRATMTRGEAILCTLTPRRVGYAMGWDLADADGAPMGRIGVRGSFRSGWAAVDASGTWLCEAVDPTAWSNEALKTELSQVVGGFLFVRDGAPIGRLTRVARDGAAAGGGMMGRLRRLLRGRDWVLGLGPGPLPPLTHLTAMALVLIEVTVPEETG
jgi:hypothetical protein